MLLNRNQTNKIYERAVEWDESFMAAFSKGIANTFSWIGSSIKKGLQKRKINALVMQWGMEYVKALHNIDTGNVIPVEHDTEHIHDDEHNIIEKDNNIKILLNGLNSGEFKNHFSNNIMSDLNIVKNYLDKLLTSINYDEEPFKSEFAELVNNDAESIKYFNSLIILIRELNENINSDKELYNSLSKYFPTELNKNDISKNKLNDFINKIISNVNNSLNTIKSNESYQYIVEASEFKLPNNITELMDEDDLKALENIKGIKEKATKNINIKTLNAILYEANYIIEKASQGKKEESSNELKKIWDLGIKNVNNYFQNVINVDKVMNIVKDDSISNDKKEDIKKQSDSIDMIPELGLSKLNPTNVSFKDKEIYAFNLDILGQTSKKLKNAYFIVSPISEYIVNIDNKSYFFFKLFGQYKTDDNGKIVRLNPFEVLTNNKSFINNFESENNSYFIVFEKMTVSNELSNIWIYSNKGSVFYDGSIHENGTAIQKEIRNFSYRDWIKIGNIFRCYINSRFLVDKRPDNLNKYPGLDISDALNDKFNEKAKENHNIIISHIKDTKKK